MSKDILGQVFADIKESPVPVSFQVDESNDVSNFLSYSPVREVQNKGRKFSVVSTTEVNITIRTPWRVSQDEKILHKT